MSNCGIYRFYNLINGKSYVGQSTNVQHRIIEHLSLLRRGIEPCVLLNKAWEKYGEENFAYEILCVCDVSELDTEEQRYIKIFDSFENGYNCTTGGHGIRGFRHSDDSRRKIGDALRGTVLSDEHKQRISEAQIGRVFSEETKQRMRDAWTEQRKAEASEKWHDVKRNLPSGAEHALSKAVIASTGELFSTITDAAKWCGIKTSSNISSCCCGRRNYAGRHPITYEKLTWRFATDTEVKSIKPESASVNPQQISTLQLRGAHVVASTGEFFTTAKSAADWCGVKRSSNIVSSCRGDKGFIGRHPLTNEKIKWRYATDNEIRDYYNARQIN